VPGRVRPRVSSGAAHPAAARKPRERKPQDSAAKKSRRRAAADSVGNVQHQPRPLQRTEHGGVRDRRRLSGKPWNLVLGVAFACFVFAPAISLVVYGELDPDKDKYKYHPWL
jgi:hypothetical protein